MRRHLPRLLMLGALLSPTTLYALGLGEIRLNSALNQPFDADIEVVAPSREELAELKVSLASTKDSGSPAATEAALALAKSATSSSADRVGTTTSSQRGGRTSKGTWRRVSNSRRRGDVDANTSRIGTPNGQSHAG